MSVSNPTTVSIQALSIPSWASNAIGAWTTIPNSTLSTDAQSVRMIPVPSGTDGSPQGSMSWSGVVAAYDQPAIYVFGGGHRNYAGNEIYRLGLTESPTWTREIDSSPGPYADNVPYYADGTPCAFHTYYAPTYDISRKRCAWIGRSDMWAASPSSTAYPCTAFDTITKQWVTGNYNGQSGTIAGGMQDVPSTGGSSAGTVSSCSNPVTGDIWNVRNNGSSQMQLWKWSTSTQTWSLFGQFNTVNWNSRGVICINTTTNDVWGFLNSQSPVKVTSAGVMSRPTLSGPAASIFTANQLTSVYYVPSLDSIVAQLNDGSTSRAVMYQLNVSTLVATQVSTTGSVASSSWSNGNVYARFHYIPSLKGVVIVPKASSAMSFCRLHA